MNPWIIATEIPLAIGCAYIVKTARRQIANREYQHLIDPAMGLAVLGALGVSMAIELRNGGTLLPPSSSFALQLQDAGYPLDSFFPMLLQHVAAPSAIAAVFAVWAQSGECIPEVSDEMRGRLGL